MSTSQTYKVATWDEWTSSISVLICTPILFIFLILHTFKTWQDLFTAERRSVAHRRHKPRISRLYKLNAALTVFALLAYALCSLFNVLQGFTVHNETQCRRWHLPVLYAFLLSKLGLYLQFITRLHQIYGQSSYGYSKRILWTAAVILCVFILATMVAGAVVIKDADIYQGYEQFPNYCHFIIYQPVLAVIALIDFVSCVACLIAFLLPLRRTMKSLASNNRKEANKQLVYVGTKYTILVMSAVCSTVILLLLIAAAGVTAAGVADFMANCVCLLLMSPYYKEAYYQRLCCLCICCCDRNRRSLKPKVEEKVKAAMEDETKTTITTSTNPSTLNISSAHSVDTYVEAADDKAASHSDPDVILTDIAS